MYLKSEQLAVGSEAQVAADVPHGAVVVGRTTSAGPPRADWGRSIGATARTGAAALVDQAVYSATSLLASVIVGRLCGAEALGVYSLGLTVVFFALAAHDSLVTAPYTVYVHRLRSASRAEYAGGTLFQTLGLCLSVAALVALAGKVLATVVTDWQFQAVLVSLTLVVPFVLLRNFVRRYLFADLRMTRALVLDATVSAFQLCGLFLLARTGTLDPATAYLALGSACAVVSLPWLWAMRQRFVIRPTRLPEHAATNWRFGRWAFGARSLSVAAAYLGHWMVALLLGPMATGTYAACATIALIMTPLATAIDNVLAPKTARAHSESGIAQLRKVTWRGTAIAGLPVGAICLVLVFAGDWLVGIVFAKPEFTGHGLTIAVLAISHLIGVLGSASDHGLRAMDRPDLSFLVNGLGITALLLSAVLIVPLGILGAALSTLCAQTVRTVAVVVTFDRLSRSLAAKGAKTC